MQSVKSISKTHIKENLRKKTSSVIVSTISEAKKHSQWLPIAKAISSSTRRYPSININQIEKATKVGDTVLIPGKVLGIGELTKRIRICALSFSQSALQKIKASKSEHVSILEEIKKNTKAEGLKIIS